MRLNKQLTEQRFFGFQSDRGTGSQTFRALDLPLSLVTQRLTSRVRSTRQYLYECVEPSSSAIAQANPAGIAVNHVNLTDSPDWNGQMPSLGIDRASRTGWIAG